MRKIYFLILAAILFVSFSDGISNTATVSGKLCDYKGNGYLLIVDNNKKCDTVIINSNGSFIYETACKEPEIRSFVLDYLGKNKANIKFYITPGAKTNVVFEGRQQEVEFYGTKMMKYVVSAQFTGSNKKECEFVNIPQKSDYEYMKSDSSAITYKEFLGQVRAVQDSLRSRLDGCSTEFKNWANSEINALPDELIITYARRVKSETGYEAYKDADFMDAFAKIDINAYDRSKVGVFSDPVSDYIWYDIDYIHPEYYKGKPEIERTLLYLKERVKDPQIKEFISDFKISMYLLGGVTADLGNAFEIYKSISGKSKYYKMNETAYNNLKKLRPGILAADFDMEDTAGKSLQFLEVVGKGKVTYVDFWATWCGPCCGEIPYMEKLAEHYKGNEKIELISISLDTNRSKWLAKLAEDKPIWKQFILPDGFKSQFSQEYNVRGIPRFMVFDKDGKIVTTDAPRPSATGIIEYLDGVINRY